MGDNSEWNLKQTSSPLPSLVRPFLEKEVTGGGGVIRPKNMKNHFMKPVPFTTKIPNVNASEEEKKY